MFRTLTLQGDWLALPALRARHVNILNNTGDAVSIRSTADPDHSIEILDGQSVRLPLPSLQADALELDGTGDVALVFEL